MFRHIRQLKRENDEMRAALRWYAARSTWRRRAKNVKGTPRRWEKSPAAHDRGDRAMRVILRIEAERVRVSLLSRFRHLMAKHPAPVITPTVPKPRTIELRPPTERTELCPAASQPISSTEFSTTESLTDAKSGKTDASVATPGETP